MSRKLLSQYHPFLYFLSVSEKQFRRRMKWWFSKKQFTHEKRASKLPFRVKKHQSKLIRKLGDSDMILQYNKIENLKIAIEQINGTIIYPDETFSFCKTVGRPTKYKGYKLGMELSRGEVRPGIGGGLCQISNLLHWLALHSPLTIAERHHHSFDPFPDNGRVLPFASGATVFYNYRDFQIKNNTEHVFQINLWLTDKCLEGEIRITEELKYAYHVEEREHRFEKKSDTFYRTNEIWRRKIDKFRGGKLIEEEFIVRNYAKVKYVPKGFD